MRHGLAELPPPKATPRLDVTDQPTRAQGFGASQDMLAGDLSEVRVTYQSSRPPELHKQAARRLMTAPVSGALCDSADGRSVQLTLAPDRTAKNTRAYHGTANPMTAGYMR